MTREDIITILNDLYLVYPRLFKDIEDPRRKERYVSLYTKYLGDYDIRDVKNALDVYIKSENGRKEPSFNDLINISNIEKRKRESKEGSGGRRIETPEEVMANLFHEEMKKPREKRNEELLEMTKYYAGLFQDPERYRAHFGAYREEFEKL